MVINEALAYGLPVISTDRCVAGVELIKNGENGFVVKADDVDSLVCAIQKISTMDLNSMKEKALDSIQKYTIENMVAVHVREFMR